ncbi:MAG: sulfite exporter TauE/SafE family protein [Lewinellaceae bacterium]|nr:sulfite exporter TauE/SafE family protein [Saprospiraceae bacterium]MCB9268324.1 sulfite exporter TauE/SafE family protein [Lewinellaceae bacterium]HPG06246.1 sulfite exporter TauE/SafE family protein [Saprospiraceae bacterium]HQU52958.1 sulfite exporter TauE/SafE family protein [Saprospiraceae bacterium]
MILWSALILGLAGSLHCVGMCGPLTLALPFAQGERPAWLQGIVYHSGRIFMYVLLGALFGLIGQAITLAGFQKYFAIIGGSLILLGVFTSIRYPASWLDRITGPAQRKISTGIGQLIRRGGLPSYFGIGMLNGVIPCGMVYAAIALAISSEHITWGMGVMALFGLGTFPLLFALVAFQSRMKPSWRHALRKISPWTMGLFGALLLYRGLSLVLPHEIILWDSFVNEVFCH